jgi:hypothetical protein
VQLLCALDGTDRWEAERRLLRSAARGSLADLL